MSSSSLPDIINEKRPRHQWSLRDRQSLCFISRMYENDKADVTAIINSLLARSLEAEGYVNGLPLATVHAQLQTMHKQGSPGYEVWREICSALDISEVRSKYRKARNSIEDAAMTLGISLRLKAEDIRVLKPSRQCAIERGRTDRKISGALPPSVSSENVTEDEIRSPRSTRRNLSRWEDSLSTPNGPKRRQLLTPTSSRSRDRSPRFGKKRCWSQTSGGKFTPVWQCKDEFGNKVRRYPRLVYRWHSRRSQGINSLQEIRAGMFVDKSITIPPPEWNIEAVTNHLVPKKILTPYISFRENLRSCIFYAMKADRDDDAYITVIDLQRVQSASLQSENDLMKPCPVLVKEFELKLGQSGNYQGRGEWLVYGKIDAEAIVTTVRISDLLEYTSRTTTIGSILQLEKLGSSLAAKFLLRGLKKSAPAMTYRTGRAVGLLSAFMRIPQIPRELREQFAAKLASSWRLRGFDKPKPNKIYETFMNGVYSVEEIKNPFQGTEEHETEDVQANDEPGEDNNVGDTSAVEHVRSTQRRAADDEQDTIDAQLQNELSLSLRASTTAVEAGTTSSDEEEETSNDIIQSIRETSSQDSIDHALETSSLAKPRDSSLFTFERPKIQGRATNWEAITRRDISPTPTDRSVLDTFTTELLAKAEEASTVGSFGRGPSSSLREDSVISLPFRGTPSDSVVGTATGQDREGMSGAGVSASEEDPIIIDVSTDEDTNDSVEELDFLILGSRKITKQN